VAGIFNNQPNTDMKSDVIKSEALAAAAPNVAIERPAEPVPFLDQGLLALPPEWATKDVSAVLPQPVRPKGMATAGTLESLVGLATRFGSMGRSLVMVDVTPDLVLGARAVPVVAHYDMGEQREVGWADWGAAHNLMPSAELVTLMGFVRDGGDHRALVRLLDALLPCLVYPEAALIHDALVRISLTKEVKFHRAEDLGSGDVALSFETITGAASQDGRVRLPDRLDFQIPVFGGVEGTWDVSFKLRYSLRDAGVRFTLENPMLADCVINEVIPELLERLREQFAGVSEVLVGRL